MTNVVLQVRYIFLHLLPAVFFLQVFLYFIFHLTDGPAPLVSSDRSLSVPVEASIEDMHVIQCEVESIQADAMVMTPPLAAADTCDREVPCNNHSSLNPFLSSSHSTPSNTVKQPVLERPILSSVHSWSHSEPVQATSKEEVCCQPTSSYDSMISSASASSHMLMSVSCPSLDQMNQQHPHSHFDRQPSWPAHPVSDTSAPDMTTGRLLNISKSGLSQDPGTKVFDITNFWRSQRHISSLSVFY